MFSFRIAISVFGFILVFQMIKLFNPDVASQSYISVVKVFKCFMMIHFC